MKNNRTNYHNSLALNAVLRESLSAFIEKTYLTVDAGQGYIRNWHIDILADMLEKCASGEINRLIINLPPRSLKSICASVAFPAWLLGHYPDKRIIAVSYAEGLANKHARDCRAIMETDWYKDTFRNTRINPHKRSESEFETTKNGCRISTSIGGVLTGRGGSMIIIDDPLKPQDALSDVKRKGCNQWFDNTLFSRLDNKETGCIIIVMQRVHMDDLVDYVQRNEDWTLLNMPAIADEKEVYKLSNGKTHMREVGDILNPALESKATLDKVKANLGVYNFSAQYQQKPVLVSGNVINWNWFRFYDVLPEKERFKRIIQSWDTAMTTHDGSDYSACVTIVQIDQQYYILNVFREKLDFPSLKRKVYEMQEDFGADSVIIENKGSGTSLLQQLEAEGFWRAKEFDPKGSKADRICAQSAHVECGEVFIPVAAPWLNDFRDEILAFPYGRNDDQIDAFSQAMDWLKGDNVSTLDIIF